MENNTDINKEKSVLRSNPGQREDELTLRNDRNIRRLNQKNLIHIGRSEHSKHHGKKKKYY